MQRSPKRPAKSPSKQRPAPKPKSAAAKAAPPPASVSPKVAAAFAKFDADKSGNLDVSELKVALQEYGISVESRRCASILKQFDTKPDGAPEC